MNAPRKRIVVGVTGASGAAYWARLMQRLLEADWEIHLVVSEAGGRLIRDELGWEIDPRKPDVSEQFDIGSGRVIPNDIREIGAPIAGGLYATGGMVVCPCSAGRLGNFAAGLSTDLVDRAVSVTLKERRPLIVVPRETPLTLMQIRNMATLAEAGAVLLPAMPGFYTHPKTVDDMVDFIVTKILKLLPGA